MTPSVVGKKEKSPLDKSYGVPQYLPFYNYVAGSLGIISAFYSTPKIFLLTLILHFFCALSTPFLKLFFCQKTKILCIFNGKNNFKTKKTAHFSMSGNEQNYQKYTLHDFCSWLLQILQLSCSRTTRE